MSDCGCAEPSRSQGGNAVEGSSEPALASGVERVGGATEPGERSSGAWIVRLVQVAVLAVPVGMVVGGGWEKRMVVDDGFIYFRIVDQLLAGHGPVFNAGQRVEVFTSPAWLGALATGRALFGWVATNSEIAVVEGIALMACAVGFAEAGAIRLAQALGATSPGLALDGTPGAGLRVDAAPDRASAVDGVAFATSGLSPTSRFRGRSLYVPAGALVLAAFPPMWHWATSGLDTALFLCWISGSFFALAAYARRLGAAADHDGPRTWREVARTVAVALLVGSGWLVRPDAVVFSFMFLATLAALQPRPRSGFAVVCAGVAPSVAYQLFRMGYFANLVPNVALAKQADQSAWGRGLDYLNDTASTYSMWPIAVLLAALVTPVLWRHRGEAVNGPVTRARVVLVAVAPLLAGLLHALWVARVGGDYLHARFALPAIFALSLPAAAVELPLDLSGLPRAQRVAAALAAALMVPLVGWSWVESSSHGLLRPDDEGQRPSYLFLGTSTNATELSDYPMLSQYGYDLKDQGLRGENVLVDTTTGSHVIASAPRWGTVGYFGSIGAGAAAAGPDVWVIDGLGLADQIGSRMPVSGSLPGHQKALPFAVAEARFALAEPAPGSDAAAVRRALGCGDLSELIDATESPLTPGRFLSNLIAAPRLARMEIPSRGVDMEAKFCPRSASG